MRPIWRNKSGHAVCFLANRIIKHIVSHQLTFKLECDRPISPLFILDLAVFAQLIKCVISCVALIHRRFAPANLYRLDLLVQVGNLSDVSIDLIDILGNLDVDIILVIFKPFEYCL